MSSIDHNEHQDSGEPPRKRVRKGTRSCWECKRRKIKCQLSSEDVPVCAGCLARGTTCLSQEYPEEREPSSNNQIGERLGRVELLLETLLAKITAYEDDEKAQEDLMAPASMSTGDVLTTHPSNAPTTVHEATPFMSLFDNSVLGHREIVPSSQPTPRPSPAESKTPQCKISRVERIRQTLADLLPSQQDADLISQCSSCWLIVHAMSPHNADLYDETDDRVMSEAFNMAQVAKKSPSTIARTIMYLTVCLQQLEPDFDRSKLHLLPTLEARVERYMSTVQALVISDDEIVTTLEGLECLILQGIYHINAGSLRRSWLAFRRALNTAQLMGINRPNTEVPGGLEFWYQILQADRYLALLLGLPSGSTNDYFGPEDTFDNPKVNKDRLFSRTLCQLSTGIIDRSQTQGSVAYATTQDIDDKLDSLAKEMSSSWWEIPVTPTRLHNTEAAFNVDRMMMQVWYYQLAALVHLPFMLRAATERRYEYSKFSCLKAAREIVYRYLALQAEGSRWFCCRVMDFGALTSTVTLLLGILQVSQVPETQEARAQKDSDRKLCQAVLKALEKSSNGGKEVIASQSVTVIKSLIAMDSPSAPKTGNVRLTIPYFGTVSIVRPHQQFSQPDSFPSRAPAILPKTTDVNFNSEPQAAVDWSNMPYQTPPEDYTQPMVSFTSSHFPSVMLQEQAGMPAFTDWNLLESDTLFFDSLLGTDQDGNWIL